MKPRNYDRSQSAWCALPNWKIAALVAPFTLGSLLLTSLLPAQAQQTAASLTTSASPSQTGVYGSAVVDTTVYPRPQLVEIKNPNQPQRRTYVIAPREQNVGGELNPVLRSEPRIQIIRVENGFLNQETANFVNFSF